MNFNTVTKSILVLVTFGLGSCASMDANRSLDEKVAAETAKTRQDVQANADKAFSSVKNISVEQKSQLIDVRRAISSKLTELGSQSIKLRSILVKDLASANYNDREVDLIKQRLSKIESKRIDAIYKGVAKINAILGRDSLERQRLIEEFMYEDSRFER